MKTIKITPEIKLHQITLIDAEDIFNAIDGQREYLGKWLPFVEHTKDVNDSKSFIEAILNAPEDKKEYVFVIHYEGVFAGLIGFRDTDKINRRTEIGYWLCMQFQKKGIITTALKFLCDFAFDQMNINRIQVRCASKNIPSKKVPERLGFSFEGTERDGELLSGGKFTDIDVYSLLAKDKK